MVWTVVCILICILVSDGMDSCMCKYVHWYLVVWKVVCMLICALVSGGMDACMYVNMYIAIWWCGRLYVC